MNENLLASHQCICSHSSYSLHVPACTDTVSSRKVFSSADKCFPCGEWRHSYKRGGRDMAYWRTLVQALTVDSVHRDNAVSTTSLITFCKRAIFRSQHGYGSCCHRVFKNPPPKGRQENITYPHSKMECSPGEDNLRRKLLSLAGVSQPSQLCRAAFCITCSSSAALGMGGRHSSFTWSRPDFTSSRGSHWKEEGRGSDQHRCTSPLSPMLLAESPYLVNKLSG